LQASSDDVKSPKTSPCQIAQGEWHGKVNCHVCQTMSTRELQNYAWGPDRRARENYHFMARGRNSHECTRIRAYRCRVTRARRPRRRYRYAAKFLDSASSTEFINEELKINTISKGFRCYRYRSKNFDAIDDCESVYSNVLIKYINIIIFSTIYKNERNWKRNILALASKTDFENSFSAISALKILYYLRKCLCCYNYYLHLSYALRYCIIWNIFMRICNINEHCSNTR